VILSILKFFRRPKPLERYISEERLTRHQEHIDETEEVYKIMRPMLDLESNFIAVPVHWLDTCYEANRIVTVAYYERNGRLEFQLYNKNKTMIGFAEVSEKENEPGCLWLHRFEIIASMKEYAPTMIVLTRGIKSIAKVIGYTRLEGRVHRNHRDCFLGKDEKLGAEKHFSFCMEFSAEAIALERLSNENRINYEKKLRDKFQL
jgi:hypothetical protein